MSDTSAHSRRPRIPHFTFCGLHFAFCLALAATATLAQIETPPPETEAAWLARYEALAAKPPAPALGAHLKRLAAAPAKARVNAARVADAFPADAFAKGLVVFDVPAMAETKRLPDAFPFDGDPGAPVRIVAARGEYEPGSFVVYPLSSLGKVQFDVGDLKSAEGATFPAKELDLKVVKVWYQAGNAWISYFQDTGLVLCPELLLHDEDLIKVDTEKVANYARLTDDKGAIALSRGGRPLASIPVSLRVLPFALPAPKTFRNLDKDFLVHNSEYYLNHGSIRSMNGNDEILARRQYEAIQRDIAAHGANHPGNPDAIRRPAIAKAVGQELDHLRTSHEARLADKAEMRYDARRLRRLFARAFPDATEYYIGFNNEYGLALLRSAREMARIYRDQGIGFHSDSRYAYAAGYDIADFHMLPVSPDAGAATAADKAAIVNPTGRYAWYACQHVGVENPAFVRRQYGISPWRAGFSACYNYAHHLGGFNDIAGDTYRSMNVFYGCGDGALDTLAWEGFREAVDDVRYATLLQSLAQPLASSTNQAARTAARHAMRLVAEADGDNFDLCDFRLSMVDAIMKMLPFSEDGQQKK